MAFVDRWQADLDASLARFAHLSTQVQDIDFTYGLLGAAILWPVRAAVQDYEPEALDAILALTGPVGKHILKAARQLKETPASAARQLGMAAAENGELRQGLTMLINHFQAQQAFAAYLAQELAPAQDRETLTHIAESIEGVLVNVGGITNIQTLAITINVPYQPPPRSRKAWLLAGALGLFILLIGAAYAWWHFNRIEPMGEGFNVAVAQFTTPDGSQTTSETSRRLSEWVYAALAEEVKRLPVSQRVVTRGPDEIGPVPGADADSRSQEAAELALRHQATVLVYGIVTGEGPEYQVQLEYFINDAGFGYGSEIAGPERLGKPITFTMPLDTAVINDVNSALNGRRQGLQHIVVGLGAFHAGRYEQAWAEFNWATGIEAWPPDEGHEVVHLLMGAARLRLYDPLTNPDELDRAQAHFEQARTINHTYARNYIGLGIIAFQKAQQIDPLSGEITAVDPNQLIAARGHFLTSLSDADQAALSYIRTKASLGLGATHLLGYEFGLEGWSREEAAAALNQVVATYETAGQPLELAWLAADAHAHLGLLALKEKDWPVMIAEHRQAIEILQNMPVAPPQNWIARYWARLGMAYEGNEELDQAVHAYEQALELGRSQVSHTELDNWATRRAVVAER